MVVNIINLYLIPVPCFAVSGSGNHTTLQSGVLAHVAVNAGKRFAVTNTVAQQAVGWRYGGFVLIFKTFDQEGTQLAVFCKSFSLPCT